MTPIRSLAIFLCLVSTSSLAGAQAQTQTATISGRVSRVGGDALKKAVVTLRPAAGPANPAVGNPGAALFQQNRGNRNQIITANDDGTFVFNNVTPGSYRIVAEREGYITQEYGQRSFTGTGSIITVGAGQRLTPIDFQLTPSGVIVGRVLDEDGEPLANVQVQALAYSYRSGERTLAPSRGVQTNDLGEYRLFWLGPGEYYVSVLPARRAQAANSDSYAPFYFPGTIEPDSASPVTLGPGAEIRGIDFIVRPVETVSVRGRIITPLAVPQNAQPAPPRGGGGRGGALRAAQSPQVMLVRDGARGGGGFGRLLQAGRQGRGNVAADGSFEIGNVIPGSYTIIAVQSLQNYLMMASAPIEIGDADIDNVTLALRPGVQVPGQIYIEGLTGAPEGFRMEQLRIVLNSLDQLPLGNVNAEVNTDGTFVLQNVATTRYRVNIVGLQAGAYLIAGRYGAADALNGELEISDQNLPLQLQIGFTPGRLDGTVTDNRDQAYPGASVVLAPVARNRADLFRTATTDQYGRFTVANLAPGEYKVFAWEEIPQGAHLDPAYLGRFEDRGRSIRVEKSGSDSIQVRVIPAN